jgi:hypothetical protein
MIGTSEVAIFSRVIDADKPELPPSVARMILKWHFPTEDRDQMRLLSERAESGTLTRAEQVQAEKYERIGHLLSTLKSKARASLKRKPASDRN